MKAKKRSNILNKREKKLKKINVKPKRKTNAKKNKKVQKVSYKEFHSIGKRESTSVPTYSENGRLFYDLHVKYGLQDSCNMVANPAPNKKCILFENISSISDSSTVACNEQDINSSNTSPINVVIHKKKRNKKKKPTVQLIAHGRREASLNAAAKMNMMFEATPHIKQRKLSSMFSKSTDIINEPLEITKSIKKTFLHHTRRQSLLLCGSSQLPLQNNPPLIKDIKEISTFNEDSFFLKKTRKNVMPKPDSKQQNIPIPKVTTSLPTKAISKKETLSNKHEKISNQSLKLATSVESQTNITTNFRKKKDSPRRQLSDIDNNYSPPKKRVAGLNASAIISAVMDPFPKTSISRSKSRNLKISSNGGNNSALSMDLPNLIHLQNLSQELSTESPSTKLPRKSPSTNLSIKSSLAKLPKKSPLTKLPKKSPSKKSFKKSQLHDQVIHLPSSSCPSPTFSGSTLNHNSHSSILLPTMERYQAQKVINYGSDCYGVENVTRQILHVPSHGNMTPTQSHTITQNSPIVNKYPIPSSQISPNSSYQSLGSLILSPVSAAQPIFIQDPCQNTRSNIFVPELSHFCPHNVYQNSFSQPIALQNTVLMSPPICQPHYPMLPSFQLVPNFTTGLPMGFIQSQPQFHAQMNYTFPMVTPTFFNGFYHNGFYPTMGYSFPIPQTHQLQSPFQSLQIEPANEIIDRKISKSSSDVLQKPSILKANAVEVLHGTTHHSPPALGSELNVVEGYIKKTPVKRVSVEKPLPCSWHWKGTPYVKLVFLKPETPPENYECYPSIRHDKDGIIVSTGDNVLLCSGPDRNRAPHVAKVTALFAHPDTGAKQMALLWYYRPESLAVTRRRCGEMELFASRHCEVNPVDCIEDRAFVLSAAAYARFMAIIKYRQEKRTHKRPISAVPTRAVRPGTSRVVDDMNIEFSEDATISNVFFCRALYDFRSRRIVKKPTFMQPEHAVVLSDPQILLESPTITQQPISSSPIIKCKKQNRNIDLDALDECSRSTQRLMPPQPVNGNKSEMMKTEVASMVSFAMDRAILDKTADLSLNWGDHGEQIALSLGSNETCLIPTSSAPNQTVRSPTLTSEIFLHPNVLHGAVGPSTTDFQPSW